MVRNKLSKVLFIRPPTTVPRGIVFQGILPPLGIMYIAAMVLKNKYRVQFIDASNYDMQKSSDAYTTFGMDDVTLEREIRKSNPDIVCVGCFTSASEFDVLKTCRIVKRVNRRLPVVVGGSHPSIFPRRMLQKDCIDYVILREGEYRLVSLLKALGSKRTDFDFDGIAYRKGGKIVVQPAQTWIEQIDDLPNPALELINYDSYIDLNKKYSYYSAPYRKAQMLVSRGCFNRCRYCYEHTFWGNTVRLRSVKKIVDEMSFLKKRYDIEEILFVDDNLTCTKNFMLAFLDGVSKVKMQWQIPLGIYPHVLDKEVIRRMVNAGVRDVRLSIESGSKRVLKEIMHRDLDLDRIPMIIGELHRYGINVSGQFVVGMIGETKKEFFESLNFPVIAKLDSATFERAFPLPGTDFFNEARKKGYLPKPNNFRRTFISQASILRIPKGSPDYCLSSVEQEMYIRKRNLNPTEILHV
ncbi:MAG TPA: radical SAM protein [Candidatus Omnitrophota bacterium]|nr:radical SAM protein [Candidatus Omnitrophota bacterium]